MLFIPTTAKEFDSSGGLRRVVFKPKLPRNLQLSLCALVDLWFEMGPSLFSRTPPFLFLGPWALNEPKFTVNFS